MDTSYIINLQQTIWGASAVCSVVFVTFGLIAATVFERPGTLVMTHPLDALWYVRNNAHPLSLSSRGPVRPSNHLLLPIDTTSGPPSTFISSHHTYLLCVIFYHHPSGANVLVVLSSLKMHSLTR